MKYTALAIAASVLIAGCAQIGLQPSTDNTDTSPDPATIDEPVSAADAPPPDPVLTSAPRPPAAARTPETLDTTSAAQRAAAAAPAAAPSRVLGKTVVSLGSPTEPGFWLKTPLVSVQTKGRVTNPANGQSSAVTLIPIDGLTTAGSRMSLPAMRLIGLPLTELTEVEVTLETAA